MLILQGSGTLKSVHPVAKASLNPSKHEFLTNRKIVDMMRVKRPSVQ